MAGKAPFWEIKKTNRIPSGQYTDGAGTTHNIFSNQPFWARLKGKNGRVIATTETYRSKQSVLKALEVANPNGLYEVRDTTVN